MLLHAISKINSAKKPVILADFEVDRFHAQEDLHQLVEKTDSYRDIKYGKRNISRKTPSIYRGLYW